MRPIRLLLIYLGIVLLGGALFAPWIYFAVQAAGEHVSWLHGLAQNPFHRFVHRAMLVLALAGLWPLARHLGIKHWADLGLKRTPTLARDAGKGFLTGFISLAGVALIAIISGARQVNGQHSLFEFFTHALTAGLTAVIVAVLEEILFRGVLFGSLRRAHAWTSALLISSAIYALVHFFSRPTAPADVTWTSGLLTLGQMLHGLVDLPSLVPGFFNLLLAGVILGMAYHLTGSLYFSIGLHAGWIFWLKFYSFLTAAVPGRATWLFGSEKLIDGAMAALVLSLTLFLVVNWLRQRQPTVENRS